MKKCCTIKFSSPSVQPKLVKSFIPEKVQGKECVVLFSREEIVKSHES